LFEKLVNAGILPRESEEGVEVQSEASFEAEDANTNSDSVMSQDPKIVLKLKELDLLIKKQDCEAEMTKLRVVERQADRDIQLHKLDLEAQHLTVKPVPIPHTRLTSVTLTAGSTDTEDFSHAPSSDSFNASKYIRLVPPFRETEVDSYFVAFKCVANKLRWPKDMWALLLQCSLTGKGSLLISTYRKLF